MRCICCTLTIACFGIHGAATRGVQTRTGDDDMLCPILTILRFNDNCCGGRSTFAVESRKCLVVYELCMLHRVVLKQHLRMGEIDEDRNSGFPVRTVKCRPNAAFQASAALSECVSRVEISRAPAHRQRSSKTTIDCNGGLLSEHVGLGWCHLSSVCVCSDWALNSRLWHRSIRFQCQLTWS